MHDKCRSRRTTSWSDRTRGRGLATRLWSAPQWPRQREPEDAADRQPAVARAIPLRCATSGRARFLCVEIHRRQAMIRSTYLSTLVLSALLGAAPAFAQNSASANANNAESKIGRAHV